MFADEHAQEHFHRGGVASMYEREARAFAEVRSHLLVELIILQQTVQCFEHWSEPTCRLRQAGKDIFGFIAIHQHVRASLLLCLLPLTILPHLCPPRHALGPLHRPHFAMHTSTTLLVSVIQWRHEQDPSAESLTRPFTRTGDFPGAVCPTVPPTHQPRQHGALPDGAAD